MKPNVREMKQEDYRGVRVVDELTQRQYLGLRWDRLSESEKETHLKSRLSEFVFNLNTGYCFVAVINKKVIGFVFAHETLPFRGKLYIRHIAVHPDYQGQGIGLLLYKKLIEKAKRTQITEIAALINTDNPQSIKLHEKAGFILKDRTEAILKVL